MDFNAKAQECVTTWTNQSPPGDYGNLARLISAALKAAWNDALEDAAAFCESHGMGSDSSREPDAGPYHVNKVRGPLHHEGVGYAAALRAKKVP